MTVAAICGLTGWWLYEASRWQRLEVTATAYNSIANQTTRVDPDIAAWGDRLEPGMRAIAVSRDLEKIGLTHGARVRVDGLQGEWVVLDRMNRRWQNKIDIYMGTDVAAARRWGRRDVEIRWRAADEGRDE